MSTARDLRFSPSESARFGMRVYRSESEGGIDAEALAREIEAEHVDVAILRTSATTASRALEALRARGFSPIVADTLVRYETRLPAAGGESDGDVTLHRTGANDAARLNSLARTIFEGYTTHYHANPLFAPTKILDGYGEWAASHATGGANLGAWLVRSNGEIAGFSCYRVDSGSGLAIGVLNGVLPAFRGRGVYRGMFRRMLGSFANFGAMRFAIATQKPNDRVQRIWRSEGLALEGTYNTIHVNALQGRAHTMTPERDGQDERLPVDVTARGNLSR